MTRIQSLGLAILSSMLAFGAQAAAPTEADLILTHGEISTPSGFVAAMAVESGVIVALGDEAAVAPFKGAATKVIDLQGAAVLPGLHDMHVHPTGAGLWQQRCMFPQGSSAQAVVEEESGVRHFSGDPRR